MICEETRNEVEVNAPRLSIVGLFGFIRRAFGCKGGHEWVGIVQKIDMFGYKAHE